MARGTGSTCGTAGTRTPARSSVHELANRIRARAAEDGGEQPVTRTIHGFLYTAFFDGILDDIAAEPERYERYPLLEPFPTWHSGAIRAEKGQEDEALIALAQVVAPFSFASRDSDRRLFRS